MERLRVARQPDVSWDKQRGRLVINWRIPAELQSLLSPRVCKRISRNGDWYRDRFAKSTTPEQAARLKAERLVEYHALLDAARSRLGTPEGLQEACEAILRSLDAASERWRTVTEPRALAEIERLNDQAELARLSRRLGIAVNLPAAPKKVVDSSEVIKTWVQKRTKDKDPPKPQAIQAKRSKLARLFAFVAGVDLPARLREEQVAEWLQRGNMRAVTESDIKRYMRKLMMDGGQREYDGYVDLSSLFVTALRYDLIDKDPFEKVDPPAKIRGKRPPMSDAEAQAVLLAAREAIDNGDVLQWAHPLAALSGGINSEILEAEASECYQLPHGPLTGTWVWDMRARRLKDSREGAGSGYRPRIIPLHSALAEWGFAAYLKTRKGKPLFEESTDAGTNKLNAFISAALTKAGFDTHRTFYSWRHRVHNKLGDDVLARYVCGHATDIHQDYISHDLPEEFVKVIAAVENRLVAPTV